MKHWLWILLLPWLLGGCVLERFELPKNYAPKHPGATAPLADGAIFKGELDANKGGEITLRFVKTGATHYVVEHFVVMPDGEVAALPPSHVRFLPLGGAHYALYWKQLAEAKQGYALVRLDARRFQLLEPMSQSSTLSLANAHGFAAKPPGLGGGYQFDSMDEARVLKFFKDLSVRKTETRLALAATKQVPADLRERTYAQLGVQIPQLTREVLGSEADAAAAVVWARTLAREGNGHAHYLLARCTTNGWGTVADGPQAIKHAEAAIKTGLEQAAHIIAAVYYFGVGVPADPARALPYARRAADAGSPNAMLLLGFAYGNGQGVDKDREAAKRWVKRAMDHKFGPAYAQWADLLITDETEAGDREAIPALESGMAHNDARAYFLRGLLHEQGRAGPKDFTAATAMFLAAAERGDAYSKFLAGERLRFGQGIAQDIPRGRSLLAEAAQAGIVDAKKALEKADPTPVQKGCEDADCKKVLAFIEKYQKNKEKELSVAEGELARLKLEQAENDAKIVNVQREIRDNIVNLRKTIVGSLDWRLYQARQKSLGTADALLERYQQAARTVGISAQQQANLKRVLADHVKDRKGISDFEARYPLHVAPRLPNGQIVVMHPDGTRIALTIRDSFRAGALDASTLPRAGDQRLNSGDEAALLTFEEAWSDVPDTHAKTRRIVSELNKLGAALDCRAGELGGQLIVRRLTTQTPAFEIDTSGVLRYRERFGTLSALHEVEEFIPLSRSPVLARKPARNGRCAEIVLHCPGNAPCAVQSSMDASVRVGRALAMYFNSDRNADLADVLLRAAMGRFAKSSFD
jgi:TPR repeat protein